jgi:hypothetical protein
VGVEFIIGTIRREYSDHILFWTTADLENKLLDFRTFFNNHRTHTSLGSTFTAWSLRFPMGTFVRLPIVSCFCNEFSM